MRLETPVVNCTRFILVAKVNNCTLNCILVQSCFYYTYSKNLIKIKSRVRQNTLNVYNYYCKKSSFNLHKKSNIAWLYSRELLVFALF